MNKRLSETITDEEIERIAQESIKRAQEEPRIADMRILDDNKVLLIELKHGATVGCPLAMFDALKGATPEQLSNMETIGDGYALAWPDLDVQMTTIALLQIALKMQSLKYAASKGGGARTEAKAAASRANGKKGGRPRKVAVAA